LRIIKNTDLATLTTRFAAGDQDGLMFIPIEGEKLTVEYGVLWLANSRQTLSVKAFLDHIKSEWAQN
jgi:DNA-binding transcriptional LysR family regulator